MKCTNCGAELVEGDKFCGVCGAPSLLLPLRFAEAEPPQSRPVYAPAVAPPPPATPPAGKGFPWKWIVLGCGGLLVVAAVIAVVIAVLVSLQLLPLDAALLQPTGVPQPDLDATATHIAADIFTTQTAAAPTPTSGSVTVRIAPDGSGDYPSLEAAVAEVAAESTIILEPGTYRLAEPLDIGKSLRLEGAGMDQTFVVGDDGEHVVKFTGPGSFAAEGITFRYEGTAWARVVAVDDGEIDFYRCRFTGGVRSEAEEKGGDGLFLWGSTTGLVQECRMEGNGLHGIEIQDQSQPTLAGNVCTNNEESGIVYFDDAGGEARKNECSENGLHGIGVDEQAQPTLEGNVCTGNEEVGIRYSDSSGGEARQNECSGNRLYGISVGDQAQPTLEGNICMDNEVDGISYWGSAGGVARQNECSRNGYDGIGVQEQAQPTLEENTCTSNEYSGIGYYDGAGGAAHQNECSGNEWGLRIEGIADPDLANNDCHGNSTADVVLFADDFSDPDSGWWTGSNDNGEVRYEDGELYILNYTDAEFTSHSEPERDFADAIMEVESRLVEGSDDNWHRHYCRHVDSDNYYVLEFSADGWYTGVAVIDRELDYWVEATESSAIQQGIGATNVVRLECVGSSIRFWVNDALLVDVTDTRLTRGDIGLGVSSLDGEYSKVAFDNLTIVAP